MRPRHATTVLLAWVLSCAGLAAVASANPVSAPRAGQARAVEAVHRERGIEVSVRVEKLDGRVVYDHLGEQPRVQASCIKLLTTAATLLQLPADHRWHTEARVIGDQLWIRGDGDPSLRLLPEGDVKEAFLDGLAAALRDAGHAHFNSLVLDDRAFDRQARPPLWPDDQWQQYYAAGVGALTVEGGLLHVIAEKGRLRLQPDPGPGIEIRRIRTNDRTSFSAWWSQADRRLTVSGSLAKDRSVRLAVRHPAAVYGMWLQHGLRQRGIECETVRRAPLSAAAAAADAAHQAGPGEPLWSHASAWTLNDALVVTNKNSDNFLAEVLLKTLGSASGHGGSTRGGIAAVRARLQELKVPLQGLQQNDGSGFARAADGSANRVSPAQMCALLRAMSALPQGRLLFDSLPVAGVEGRLKNMFQGALFQPGKIRSKTGWITGASSLSGFAEAPDGTPLVFSIVVNYRKDNTPRTNNKRFRALQEQVLAELFQGWPRVQEGSG